MYSLRNFIGRGMIGFNECLRGLKKGGGRVTVRKMDGIGRDKRQTPVRRLLSAT